MSHTPDPCPCVTEHRPGIDELDVHHRWPLSWGGPDVAANRIAICPNQHRQTHELLREYRRFAGTPPWHVRQGYSVFTRALAKSGWDADQTDPKEFP